MGVCVNSAIEKKTMGEPVTASAPCRIDMGGTLDISTFYLPLRYVSPCTFNISIDLRTKVRITPYHEGVVKVSSSGFESVEFPGGRAPFKHPLGLMFAIAAYFHFDGIHIDIDSASPPRSALGGSSAAAVALVAAFSKAMEPEGEKCFSRDRVSFLSQAIEASIAGVPCGFQDHLAAVHGGVNAWYWSAGESSMEYKREILIDKESGYDMERNLVLAYCGAPHESKDINGRWVELFLDGRYRGHWENITVYTREFIEAFKSQDFSQAALLMNQEVNLRREMTPDVLDEVGVELVDSAVESKCGARFTGAGGGGCIWAIGEAENIEKLIKSWSKIISERDEAELIDFSIDYEGLA